MNPAGTPPDEATAATPVRVLAISARADVGGGPEHLLRLYAAMGSRAEVVIACPRQAPYWDRFAALPNLVDMIEIPVRRVEVGALRRLVGDVRRTRVTLIHSHGKGAGALGRPLSLLTRVPCVHTYHGLHTGEYSRLALRAYLGLERCLSWLTKYAICVSPGECGDIRAVGICPADKLRVIPNGVALPKRAGPHTGRDAKRLGPLCVVSVSRYNEQKNAGLAIDIIGRLEQWAPGSVHLTMVGSGDDYPTVAARVEATGLDPVVDLVGEVPDLRPLLRDADVFLSTSRWEGLPISVLEAMSEERVVVATDVVGNRDAVVDGVTGILYPSNDADAGASALLQLRDRDVRAELAAAARLRVAEHFTVDQMAATTLATYRDAIAEPKPRPA